MPTDLSNRTALPSAGSSPGSAPGPSFGEAAEELVAIHCEATSYDAASAVLRRVVAIPIRGPRILTSRHVDVTFGPEEPARPMVEALLPILGSRPLVGYFLDFTVTLLDRLVQPVAGAALANRRVEVSSLYYERKTKVPGKNAVDLRLDSIVRDLDLPARGGDDAYASALTAALVYLRLEGA